MKREELIWGGELKPFYPPRKRKVEGGGRRNTEKKKYWTALGLSLINN